MRSSYRTSMWVKDGPISSRYLYNIEALAHSMIEGRVRSGLPREVAYKLTLQTMKGTAELLLIDGLEPNATVPNGRNAEWDEGSRSEGDGGARSPVRDQ